jgi:hypothetical protein
MSSSSLTKYSLAISGAAASDPLTMIYKSSGMATSDLVAVYHYTDFTSVCQIQVVNDGLPPTTSSLSSTVTVTGFSTSYGSSSSLYCRGGADGQFTIYGQHQGVFLQEQWYVRNNLEDSGKDATGSTRDEFVTVKTSTPLLPDVYLSGFKAVPDMTRATSISMTVTVTFPRGAQTTSLTISNITQTVANDWDRFRLQIRPFVLTGTIETGNVTTYRTAAFVNLPAATFAVTNTTSATSGATITVRFAKPHNVASGSVIVVAITSTATNHSFAQGTFFAETWPTTSSFTYTVTSIGTISTTTSLLGAVGYYR